MNHGLGSLQGAHTPTANQAYNMFAPIRHFQAVSNEQGRERSKHKGGRCVALFVADGTRSTSGMVAMQVFVVFLERRAVLYLAVA